MEGAVTQQLAAFFDNGAGRQAYLKEVFDANPRLLPAVPGTYVYEVSAMSPDVVVYANMDITLNISIYGIHGKVILKNERFAFYLRQESIGNASPDVYQVPPIPMICNYWISPVNGGYEFCTSASSNSSNAYLAFDGSDTTSWTAQSSSSINTEVKRLDDNTVYNITGNFVQAQTNMAFYPRSMSFHFNNTVTCMIIVGSADGVIWRELAALGDRTTPMAQIACTTFVDVGPVTHMRFIITHTAASLNGSIFNIVIRGSLDNVTFKLQSPATNDLMCGSLHAGLLTHTNQLVTIGSNQSGQMGIGSSLVPNPLRPAIPSNLLNSSVFGKACSYYNTTEVTNSVFIDSFNNAHVLDSNRMAYFCITGSGSLAGRKVTQGTCLSYEGRSVILLDTIGQVHGFRLTASSTSLVSPSSVLTPVNLSLIDGTSSLRTPTVISSLAKRPGLAHMLAIGTNGVVHAWGLNTSLQLGVPGTFPFNNATLVTTGSLSGKIVKFVTAACFHSYAIDNLGDLHVWGSNSSGTLGLGHTNQITAPVCITQSNAGSSSIYAKRILVVDTNGTSADINYTMAVDNMGHVHFWGRPVSSMQSVSLPTNMSLDQESVICKNASFITNVSTGIGMALACDVTGRMYMWEGSFTYPKEVTSPLSQMTTLAGPGANEPTSLLSSTNTLGLTFSSSSQLSGTNEAHRAFGMRGFNSDRRLVLTHWASAYGRYNTQTGAYTGTSVTTVNGVSVNGEWVQCTLQKHALRLYQSFINDAGSGIATGTLAGSMDGGVTWISLGGFACQDAYPNNLPAMFRPSVDGYYNAFRIIVQQTGNSALRPLLPFSGNATLKDIALIGTVYDTLLPQSVMRSNVGSDAAGMYRAMASSNSSNAYLAFDGEPTTEWKSVPLYNNVSGLYNGSSNTSVPMGGTLKGEYIHLDYGMPGFVINRVVLTTGSTGSVMTILGTNNGSFHVLASGIAVPASTERTVDISTNGTTRFQSLRVVFVSSSGTASLASLRAMCIPVAPVQSFYCRSSWIAEAGSFSIRGATMLTDGGIVVAGMLPNGTTNAYNTNGSVGFTFAGSTSIDGVLVKYTAQGDVQWRSTIQGTGTEFFADVARTSTGRCVACGAFGTTSPTLRTSQGNSTYDLNLPAAVSVTDPIVVCYSPNGEVLWHNIMKGTLGTIMVDYEGLTSGPFAALVSCHQETNAVYVAGKYTNSLAITYSNGTTFKTLTSTGITSKTGDIVSFLVKYDSNGNVQWAARFGSINTHGEVRAMAVGPNGESYVCMIGCRSSFTQTCVAYSSSDVAFPTRMTKNAPYHMLAKYTADGGVEWVMSAYDVSCMTCSPSGLLYAVSTLQNSSAAIYDIADVNMNSGSNAFPDGVRMTALVQYTPSGGINWIAVSRGVSIIGVTSTIDNGAVVHYQSASTEMRFYHACNRAAFTDILYDGSVMVKYNAFGAIQWHHKCSPASRARVVESNFNGRGLSIRDPVNNDVPVVMNATTSVPGGRNYAYFSEPNTSAGASLLTASYAGINNTFNYRAVTGIIPGVI